MSTTEKPSSPIEKFASDPANREKIAKATEAISRMPADQQDRARGELGSLLAAVANGRTP